MEAEVILFLALVVPGILFSQTKEQLKEQKAAIEKEIYQTKQLLDKFSVIMALKALDRCDVAILLLDAMEAVTDQDATVAGYALDRGKGCIIIGNKWDLMRENEISFEDFERKVRHRLKFLEFAPIITVSAKSGMRIDKI